MRTLYSSLAAGGLLALLLLSAGCTQDVPKLKKASGSGTTSSEYFKPYDRMDERKRLAFYQPVALEDAGQFLPENVQPVVHEVDPGALPFKPDEEKVYLVTSKGHDGDLVYQVQTSFLERDEYRDVENFLIISATEAKENPLISYQHVNDIDSVGNRMTEETLADGLPIYQQIRTTDSALMYTYYQQDGSRINRVATAANEFYAYYNGHIYHAGYSVDGKKNDPVLQARMLEIVREYILSDSSAGETAGSMENNHF